MTSNVDIALAHPTTGSQILNTPGDDTHRLFLRSSTPAPVSTQRLLNILQFPPITFLSGPSLPRLLEPLPSPLSGPLGEGSLRLASHMAAGPHVDMGVNVRIRPSLPHLGSDQARAGGAQVRTDRVQAVQEVLVEIMGTDVRAEESWMDRQTRGASGGAVSNLNGWTGRRV